MSDETTSTATATAITRLSVTVIAELEAQLSIVAARRLALQAGSFDPDLASAAASLSKALTSAMTESRGWIRMADRAREALKADVVMDWLRKQSAEVRLHFVREISSTLDEETGVLG